MKSIILVLVSFAFLNGSVALAKPGDQRKQRDISTVIVIKTVKECNPRDPNDCKVASTSIEHITPEKPIKAN